MIEQVSATLHELGVDSARVHAEHFTVATTPADPARRDAQAPARVPLRHRGRRQEKPRSRFSWTAGAALSA